VKCLFPPILGGGFGVWPLNVVGYCWDFKRHILHWKHAFWGIDRPDRSKVRPGQMARKAKRRRKEKKLRDVTSHRFSQTTHIVLPPHKCPVGCGPGQPCQVSTKSVQGFWLLLGSWRADVQNSKYFIYKTIYNAFRTKKSRAIVQSRASRVTITSLLSRQSVGHPGHAHQFSSTGRSLADITWHWSMSLTVLGDDDDDERHTSALQGVLDGIEHTSSDDIWWHRRFSRRSSVVEYIQQTHIRHK